MTTPTRVLIADDDELIRLIARAILEKAGMEVVETSNGAEALALLFSEQRFDLLLLDLDMPGVHGLDVLRTLRTRPKRIPVLVISGASHEDAQEAIALGAAGIFPKPIVAEGLLRRVRELVA